MKLRILIALASLLVCGAGCVMSDNNGFTVSAPSTVSSGAGTAISGGAEMFRSPIGISQ